MDFTKMICFLLAAGEGRRLRPTTEKFIKPSLPFLNLPLAYYGFFLAEQAGFKNFLLNKHHLPNQVETLAKDLSQYTSQVKTVDETERLLGSGGALWNAKKILDKSEYFLVANGDEVLFPENETVLKDLVDFHKRSGALCSLLTCHHPELRKTLKPVWVDHNNHVQGFGMDPITPESRPVHYTGYKVFSRKIFDYVPKGVSNIFYDVVKDAISKGKKVNVMPLEKAAWYETGNFDSFLKASQSVVSSRILQVNQRLLRFGRRPIATFKNEKALVVVPEGIKFKSENRFNGFVNIGEKVTLSEDVSLENLIVASDVAISGKGFLKNQIIMEDQYV